MIHPSYTELMQAINNDAELDDMPPVINSRYSVVIATSKRARQIIAGDVAMVDDNGKKPLSVAVDEIYQGKVKLLPGDQEEE